MARPRKHAEGSVRIAVTLPPEFALEMTTEADRLGVTLSDVVLARLKLTPYPAGGARPAVRTPPGHTAQTSARTHPGTEHQWGKRSTVTGLKTCLEPGCIAVQR